MTGTNNYLPLMLDLSDRKVVIFGGGSVGERKAELFCSCAKTTVVSLGFSERLQKMEACGKVRLVRLDLSGATDSELRELVTGAFLVIPATSDSSLNGRITAIAGESDILINQVDTLGSVVIPSVIKRGDLVIGISTLGKSPALSKYSRRKIESLITPQYSDMIRLQDELRSYLKEHVGEQKKRKELLWLVLENENVWESLAESYEKAAELAYSIVSDHSYEGFHEGSDKE